jgi:hypothetical protein
MNDRQERQSFSSLPRPQKIAVILLSLVACGIIGVWIWQFENRINSPFRLSPEDKILAEEAAKKKAEEETINRTKDTDKDGLSDYDEINIYGTSPYLEDTDGDNISDFDEVRIGKDPLCAEGSDCSLFTSDKTDNLGDATEEVSQNPAEKVEDDLLIKALSGDGNAETMRQILLQAGASKEEVDLISDEDLMNMYMEILSVQNPAATFTATTSSQ